MTVTLPCSPYLSAPPRTPEEVHETLRQEGLEMLQTQGVTPAYWRNVGLRLALDPLLYRRRRARNGCPLDPSAC